MTNEHRTIEIDLDVYKIIVGAQRSFSETPNDILRRLLHITNKTPPTYSLDKTTSPNERSWSDEGVTLPHGTKLKMNYNGRTHEGIIFDGKWNIEGKIFSSPSGAASGTATTKRGKNTRLDGWKYWEVKRPEDKNWILLQKLRDIFTVEDL